jgi:hypothetical protein
MTELSKETMDQILEEVASYSVQLEEDPTLPHLGTKYLQKILAQCRNYMNRVQHYLQLSMRAERSLLTEIKHSELDLDFKVKEKLSEDVIVRQQRSLEDRKATAEHLLSVEAEALREKRVKLVDVQETVKLLKFKYSDLQRTNNDIKMQRNMVKDDKFSRLGGDEGFDKPQVKQDKSVPDGMPAAVPEEPLGPKDILDPNTRPDDMPEPLDAVHAQQMAEFLHKYPVKKSDETSILRKPNGLLCSICRKPQFETPGGETCENGHGGADGVPIESEPKINSGANLNYEDLLT